MAESPPEASIRPASGHVCPRCGARVFRAHRYFTDRLLGLFRDVRRYRCRMPDCGWQGLLGDEGTATGPAAGGSSWRAALAVVAAALVSLVVVSGLVYWNAKRERAEPPAVGFTPGGTPLAADDPRVKDAGRTAKLRRGCVWTGPVDAPYLGTFAAALAAARVPDDIARKFEIMREGRLVTDRLEITNTGIATPDHRRFFGRVASAMTVGDVLCFSTQVSPPNGTTHAAELYETLDTSGRHYAIMVVAVGGNVALLDEQPRR